MSDRLVTALQANRTDPAVLPHAMRYLVSAWADDPPPAVMRDQLTEAGLSSSAVDRAVADLERDPALLEAAALAILQAGFEDEGARELADGALGAAQSKLPVVEAGLIAVVAAYGLWLAATKGRRSHHRTVRRGADGSWEEVENTEWYGPTGPLNAITKVLGLNAPPADPTPVDAAEQPSLPPASQSGQP